jgi:4-amino-4-deoxychorismate lyase
VGDRLVTPGTGLGILDGTTQSSIFRYAESIGFETKFQLLTPEELRKADAIWLVSSVRHAAPVRDLDGQPIAVEHELTAGINQHLGALTE